MPSVISHIAIPIAGRLALGRSAVLAPLLVLGLALSALPDVDVILLRLGVPYESPLGHRGASHSVVFALLSATLAAFLFARFSHRRFWLPWLYLLACAVSHPLLDTCTNAGHGAALLWPFSDERFFAPFRPIEASPLSLRRFFGEAGLRVLWSELLWVWLPFLAMGLGWQARRKRRGADQPLAQPGPDNECR